MEKHSLSLTTRSLEAIVGAVSTVEGGSQVVEVHGISNESLHLMHTHYMLDGMLNKICLCNPKKKL